MIRRTTWIVLLVFIAALAVVLYLQRSGKLESAVSSTPNPTEAAVFGLDTGSITQLRIEIPGSDQATFTRNADGTWMSLTPEGFNPDSATVNEALGQIADWTIQNELQIAPPLEAVGLNSPSHLLVLQMDSGQEHTIQVGNLNPAQTGYYLQLDGGSPFLVSRYSIDPVLGLLDLLHVTPTPPSDSIIPDATTPP